MRVKCILNIVGDGDLDIDKIYTVYAMSIWENSLCYLLADNYEPNWCLAERFEIIDHLLPILWYFNFKKDEKNPSIEPLKALWGYKEMVFDPQHYIDLIECKPEALEIFKRRKEEIDEYEELRKMK